MDFERACGDCHFVRADLGFPTALVFSSHRSVVSRGARRRRQCSVGYPAFADFYGSRLPPAELLLARSNYADENPLVEYRLGKGRIIILGWRIPLYALADNFHREELAPLTGNIINYLARK